MSLRMKDYVTILRAAKLRDTQPRRLVLQALIAMGKPLSPKDIYEWCIGENAAINLVTVYRILEKFEEQHIIHKHPSSGGVTLCSLPEEGGHHGFLSCQSCGRVEEFSDSDLCKEENRIAESSGFRPRHHVSEIIGECAECVSHS